MTPIDTNPILFEHAPEAILLLSRDGQVLSLNREACRVLSLGVEAAVGNPILAHVGPDDRDRVKDLFLRVLGGQQREWICHFRRGDGVTRGQWVRAVPVVAEGTVKRIVVFMRNLTGTQEGRPESVQLRKLLENLPGQLVTVVTDGRIRYSSGISRTHFRDDVGTIGALYLDLLEPGEENERLLEDMLGEVEAGRDWGGTHWHRRMDGTVFPVRTFASPYRKPQSGRILGALVVGRDVSQDYDWRERAHRAQRLAGIGNMVAGVAGELDQAVRRIETALQGGVPGDGLTDGYSVVREMERMKSVAGDLVAFATEAEPQRERLQIADLASSVLEEMAPRIPASSPCPTLEVDPELPPVYADPGQMRRVLRILLENAVESGNGSGPPPVSVTLSPTTEGVRLKVTDGGKGADPEDLHRFFDPFFTTKQGHAGLGLSIAKALVQVHGGNIRAEAESPGISIIAEIPREAPDARVRFRPSPLALSRHRSVLVVDDEVTVRRSIGKFLEKVGFDVREAWSGRTALAQITVGSPPEIVITDLKMSDGSGAWFLEQLSRDFPDLLRRTLIVTGDTDQAAVSRVIRDTGCQVLAKPIELAQLLDVLDEVAARS